MRLTTALRIGQHTAQLGPQLVPEAAVVHKSSRTLWLVAVVLMLSHAAEWLQVLQERHDSAQDHQALEHVQQGLDH